MRTLPPLVLIAACVFAAAPGARAQEPAPAPAPAPAPQQDPPAPDPQPSPRPEPRRRFTFGPNFGLYLPTSGKTRDAFGESWTNIGFGVGQVRTARRGGVLSFDFAFINNNRGSGRRAFLAPVGVSYRGSFVDPEDENGNVRSIIPYYGASAGLYLANLDSDKYDVDTDLSVGGGGSALVGVAFQRRAFLEARYHAVSRIRGFDLSGLNIALGLRF